MTFSERQKLEKEYLVASTIDIDVTITDVENDAIVYSVYAYVDGRKYTLINNKELVSSTASFSYECFAIECENCYFVVEANDGYGIVSEQTQSFNVVKSLTPVTPPHEHNFIEGECECGEVDPNYVAPKKKCGKKAADLVAACLGLATMVSLILRKKD